MNGFVRDTAVTRPVALFIDDLHWADEASLDLLQHLARHARVDRVLLVGTYRDVAVGRRHPLRKAVRDLDREQLVERVAIRRLGREETAALIADRLDGMEVSEEFAGLVYEHTEGNPFFTNEVLEALIQRGNLFMWEGHWVRSELDRIEVPESVREIIAERTSRLEPEARETLEEASILGQRFAFDDLRALSDRDEEEVEEALEEAGRAGLVRGTEEEHAFNHALTHQAIYADIPRRRRRRLHLAAGEALERHPERVRRLRASEISRHLIEGKAPARALPYARLAGDAAGAVFAYTEAERHYRRALELAEEVGDLPGAAGALRSIGEALTSAGRYDEALAALKRAAELAAQIGDHEGEVWAAARIGWVHFWMGRPEEELIARLWTLAGHDRPGGVVDPPGVSPRTLLLLRSALSALLFVARDYQRTLEVARQYSILARKLGNRSMVARAEITYGGALVYSRRPAEALKVLEEAIPLAEEINSPGNLEEGMPLAEKTNAVRSLADGILLLNLLYMARGELDRSLQYAERSLAIAEQLGNRDSIAFRLDRVGLNLFYRGEWEKARVYMERAAETVRSFGLSHYSRWSLLHLSMLCTAEGAWEEAARLLEETAGMAEQAHLPSEMLHYAQILQAELDLLKGHPRAALARLEPLAGASEDLDWIFATVLLTVLAQACLEPGDAKGAEAFAERVLQEAEQVRNRLDAAGALRVKGMAQGRQGRWDEAAGTLQEALALVRPMPYPYAEARILHEYGSLHLQKAEPDRARERFRAALGIFRRLGASKDIERTERALLALDPA